MDDFEDEFDDFDECSHGLGFDEYCEDCEDDLDPNLVDF